MSACVCVHVCMCIHNMLIDKRIALGINGGIPYTDIHNPQLALIWTLSDIELQIH